MIKIVTVTTAAQQEEVLQLRNAIYVQADKRIEDVTSFDASFDRYNEFATYFLIYDGTRVVGCFKIIRDSSLGLPCESIVDLSELKKHKRVLEIGHLLVIKEYKSYNLVKQVFGYILTYARSVEKANYLVGDIFDQNNHYSFYSRIGFTTLYGPYQDPRFLNAPMSIVIGVDLDNIREDINRRRGLNGKMIEDLFNHESAVAE